MNKVFILLLMVMSSAIVAKELTQEHADWLKDKMLVKHKELIPKVMVADIYFGCNLEKKIEPITYPLSHLVEKVSKKLLSEKLVSCLGNSDIRSEQAINYGLVVCFSQQFKELTKEEQQENMQKVRSAIATLTRNEKQQSFLKCTTQQAIQYIN